MTPIPHPILTTENTEEKTHREHREKIVLFYPTHNPKKIFSHKDTKDTKEKELKLKKQKK